MAIIMKVVLLTTLVALAIIVWWMIDGERKAKKDGDS